jgi:metal-responsive CopG/Arc/MetJ family transcriptional regulator
LKLEEALLRGLEMSSVKEEKEQRVFTSISLPASLVREVEKVVEKLGYWPNKTAFMHEAVMKKVEAYKKELEAGMAREGAVA